MSLLSRRFPRGRVSGRRAAINSAAPATRSQKGDYYGDDDEVEKISLKRCRRKKAFSAIRALESTRVAGASRRSSPAIRRRPRVELRSGTLRTPPIAINSF